MSFQVSSLSFSARKIVVVFFKRPVLFRFVVEGRGRVSHRSKEPKRVMCLSLRNFKCVEENYPWGIFCWDNKYFSPQQVFFAPSCGAEMPSFKHGRQIQNFRPFGGLRPPKGRTKKPLFWIFPKWSTPSK